MVLKTFFIKQAILGKICNKITVCNISCAGKHSKGNKTVPEKVATTRTEDGHKQNTKTGATI